MAMQGNNERENIKAMLQESGLNLPDETFSVIISVFEKILNSKFTELNDTIENLNKSIEALSARINRNCKNSNNPSSNDKYVKPSPRKSEIFAGGDSKAPKKKTGGQKGHKGTTMKVKDTPDETVRIYPGKYHACPNFEFCKQTAKEGIKRTVVDVEIRTIQTEYVQMSMCFACDADKSIAGDFPAFASYNFQYGPRLKAIVADLSSDGAVSMDRLEKFVNSAFGVSMTDATVHNILEKGAALAKPVIEKMKEAVSKLHVVHFDETGGRFRGKNAWFHIASSALYTLYGFSQKRGRDGIEALGIYQRMTDPGQVAVTDFWKPYLSMDGEKTKKHAFCCAHIDRELQNLIDNHGNPASARKMKKLLKEAYVKVQKLKEQGIGEATKELIDEISGKYDRIVKAALNKFKAEKPLGKRGRPKKGIVRALFERFRDYKDGIMMFLNDFEVPFSNNRAEVSARSLKCKLKVSGCFRGKDGAENFCRLDL